ncbi:MAG: hypothetical protein R6V04_09595 [bacterium]
MNLTGEQVRGGFPPENCGNDRGMGCHSRNHVSGIQGGEKSIIKKRLSLLRKKFVNTSG